MPEEVRYQFRRIRSDDTTLLKRWLSAPHVKDWWDSEIPTDPNSLSDPHVRRWVVSYADQPFAYLQDYDVHGWDDHHFFDLPRGTRGVDQYIGELDMIGQGHGTRFLSTWVSTLFQNGAPVVVTDPHPDNARAIAAYRKVGFNAFGAPLDTKWGPILPMKMTRPDVSEAND